MPGSSVEPTEVFARLNTLIHGRPEAQAVYQAVVAAAVELVDGCDHASMMLVDRAGRFYSAAATDDVGPAADVAPVA